MKIVFMHSLPIPVLKYGGTERILYWHLKELVRLGHEVVLIGHKDCKLDNTGIELIVYKDKNDWLDLVPKDADILHLQFNYIPQIEIPVINTLHGNGQVGETFPKNTVFVGKKHAQNHGAKAYVHNALDLDEYPFDAQKKTVSKFDNFLFLAKASWSVKNLKDCISACKKSKKHLNIAGGKKFSFSSYIHNHGFVDNTQKMELFKKNDALLFPVKWEEPFGIAIIEAMAQGLPVIGSRHGSLPEIITKETGVICQDYDEFIEAINRTDYLFDPVTIRKHIEDHFSIKQYSLRFIQYYQDVIDKKELNENPPSWCLPYSPKDLLKFQK